MARLLVKTPGVGPDEILLNPGCNVVGREAGMAAVLAHDSVSHRHCEVWLTEEAVLVRDLQSRHGTFIDGAPVFEAELLDGQVLRVGDIELELSGAPVRITVPDLPLPAQPRRQMFLEDGTPACHVHDGVASIYQCQKCVKTFCGQCVRELRVAGGTPRRFCPACGGPCERLPELEREKKRGSWLDKIFKAFTKPADRP
jgi:hypothetical protein